MKNLIIRNASDGDVPAIAELVNAAYRPQAKTQGWTHESEIVKGQRTNVNQVVEALQKSSILVGVRDDTIVACVQIEIDGGDAYIGMLATVPSLQTAGIGKAMLNEAERHAVSIHGASRFKLAVVSARTELIQFYQRRGYGASGEILQYPKDAGVGTPLTKNIDLIVLIKHA